MSDGTDLRVAQERLEGQLFSCQQLGNHARATELRREISAIKAERYATFDGTPAQFANADRVERIAQAAQDPRATISGAGSADEHHELYRPTTSGREALPSASDSQRKAHAALASNARDGLITTEAASRISDVLDRDTAGLDAAYVASVASREYEQAFAELIRNPTMAHLKMSQPQADAVRDALAAQQRRASGFRSGFSAGPIGESTNSIPLPLTADPTLSLQSGGVADPFRQFADVRTITTSTYVAGFSAGSTATWYPEFSEVTDDSPTIDDLVFTPQRASLWTEWSIEVDADWADVRTNLTRIASDAKARLEATAWLTGGGDASSEPQGILSAATATMVVTSSTATGITVADLITVQDDLSPQYQQAARWYSRLSVRNGWGQLVPPGSTTVAPIIENGLILNRPWAEVSNMDSAGAGHLVALYGDLRSCYRIVDRLGMQMEIAPLVLGSNRRPSGTRGAFFYWRTTANVIDANALKILKQHS